ncbi:MAG TPA: DUF4912 domain-containing protein [Blastocatellia bacterium]|nr:DUF4912 domain-containing protein [Blastocatellia bacterium]
MIPTVGRNPFEPVVVPDEPPAEPVEEEIPAEPIADTGLPIPSHYDFDMMRAMVQDPFRIFVYWQLKDDPFERVRKIFPAEGANGFHTSLKLTDETNNISVFFDAAFAREYWFHVFPDRTYQVELGMRSPRYGYIKLLNSQPVTTPRAGPSNKEAEEPEYQITADDFLRVLRESHLVPERAFTLEGLLPGADNVPAGARGALWDALPASFRRLVRAMADIQSGRDYEQWWERLDREELAGLVREFLMIINQMGGGGELGYMLLLRYLPELLRRSIQADGGGGELLIDKPISLYLAEKLGQTASEITAVSSSENFPAPAPPGQPGPPSPPVAPGSVSHGQWMPSMKDIDFKKEDNSHE